MAAGDNDTSQPRLTSEPVWVRSDPDLTQTDPAAIRQKCGDARRTHADRSLVAHAKDPARPAYTTADLEYDYGWTLDAMYHDYQESMYGRCPCYLWVPPGYGCGGRYMIELDRREISVDIIDPSLPPVWGRNTQYMCVPGNRIKHRRTRAQAVADEMTRLTQRMTPTPPSPPVPRPPRTKGQDMLPLWDLPDLPQPPHVF